MNTLTPLNTILIFVDSRSTLKQASFFERSNKIQFLFHKIPRMHVNSVHIP